MVPRRTVLVGAAAACLAGGLRPAAAATPMTFTTPFGFDPGFLEILNAYSGGHFAREGLDAKIVGPPGTSEAFQLVISNQAQFGMVSSLDFIRVVAQRGAALTAFATIGQSSGFCLVSLADKPVQGGADLAGKTVGVLSVGGFSETLVDVLLAQAGVAKSAVRVIAAGNNPGEVELIRQGRLDCFVCNFSVAFTLRRTGAPIELVSIDERAPAPGQLYYALTETLNTRPDLVRAVLRALKASIAEVMKGPLAPLYERAGKDFDIPGLKNMAGVVALEEALIAQLWLGQGRENLLRNIPARWQSAVDQMRAVGIADVKDPTTLYTNKFLDETA